jgi:hypothetical protein
MPTHSGHDQTSKAHETRAAKDSLKRRRPETYAKLDAALMDADAKSKRRKYFGWTIVLVVLIAAFTGLSGIMT